MILILQLRVAAIALQSASPQGAGCPPVDAGAIRAKVEAVLTSSDASQTSLNLGYLGADWRAICFSSRRNAGRAIVTDLARLLRIRQARWVVATMLLDVSSNLRYAEPSIRAALRDQEAVAREYRRTSPVMLQDPNGIPRSLRCLLNKIRYLREDQSLCQDLQSLRNGD